MSPISSLPTPTSIGFTAIPHKALTTPYPNAANGVPSILEALAENNIAQWLMLALAVPAGGYALYQIGTCIQQLVGAPHRSMLLAQC
jgi:hypothetical protein